MSKITLANVNNLQDTTTSANTINSNMAIIQPAFDNTLSRNGQSPNQMLANLDMNSNQILNLPSPATVNSPARLVDVVTNPTITVPPVGTSGATVPLLNANNTFSGNNTFTGTTTLGGTNLVTGNNTYTGTNTFSQNTTFSTTRYQNGAFYAHNALTDYGITPQNVSGVGNQYIQYRPIATKFNVGNYYNITTGIFTPPTGVNLINLKAAIWITSGFSNPLGGLTVKCYKNFTTFTQNTQVGIISTASGTQLGAGIGNLSAFGGTTAYIHMDCYDVPSPGDYYGFFVYCDVPVLGSTTIILNGNDAHTYIQGSIIS